MHPGISRCTLGLVDAPWDNQMHHGISLQSLYEKVFFFPEQKSIKNTLVWLKNTLYENEQALSTYVLG